MALQEPVGEGMVDPVWWRASDFVAKVVLCGLAGRGEGVPECILMYKSKCWSRIWENEA